MLDVFLEEGHIAVLNTMTQSVLGWGWSWWILVGIAIITIGLLAWRVGCNANIKNWRIAGVIFIIAGMALSLFIASHARVVDTYEIYEVTIDNYVPFKDFNEVCEILDHRGAIYTIKLRE